MAARPSLLQENSADSDGAPRRTLSSLPQVLSRSRDDMLEKERLRRALPIARNPFHSEKLDRGAQHDLKPTWLMLFQDVLFVAALSVFATTHEASSGAEVGSFVALIVLLWWSWMSSTLFDVKYARDDVMSQFFAWVNICIFAFIGAWSVGFRPAILYHEPDLDLLQRDPRAPEPSAEDLNAYTSWEGVLIAFAIGRLVLGLRYVFTWVCYGVRKAPSPALLLPLVGIAISGGISIGLAFDQASTSTANATRLGLLYAAIALEMILAVVVAFVRSPVRHSHSHLLLERMGLLTLIVIGEGFIALLKNMATLVTGFSFDSELYLYVYCSISLYFLAWYLIFSPFNAEATMSAARTQVFALLHLFLHVPLLLWLEAVVLCLLWYNFQQAGDRISRFVDLAYKPVYEYFEPFINGSRSGFPTDNFTLIIANKSDLAFMANYLELSSSYFGQFEESLSANVGQITQAVSDWAHDNPTGNVSQRFQLAFNAFYVQMVSLTTYRVASSYGVSMEKVDEIYYSKVKPIDYDFGDVSPGLAPLLELILAIANAIAPASLFILPCCGAWLLMTVLLTQCQRPVHDRFDVLLLAYRGFIGFALCMLGLLDIGHQLYDLDEEDVGAHPNEDAQDFARLEDLNGIEHNSTAYSLDSLPFLNGTGKGRTYPSAFAKTYTLLETGWILPLLVLCLSSIVVFEFSVLWFAKRAYKRGALVSASPVEELEEKGEEAVP